ncbi:MAG: GNAT family N-acetyltransferase [Solirubrobacteraceae bacterium]
MGSASRSDPVPRSLVWATDLDVLPPDRQVLRRPGYVVIRSPSNPTHYWGNALLFDDPPTLGDRARWEDLFRAEFADQPATEHLTFGWDRTDGEVGAADTEFVARGYDLERNVGLLALATAIRPHPRANREVQVRALDPQPGADAQLWDEVIELQVAGRDPGRFAEEPHRHFTRSRLDDLRTLFCAGRGAWYVAVAPGAGVVGSLGIVVTGTRGRFQAVDTAASHRRRGICSRLVVDAARDAVVRHGARRLVIVADPDYHAIGIYESLGFTRAERSAGVCLAPAAERPPNAD